MTSTPKPPFNEKDFSFRFKRLPQYKTLEGSSCSCCTLSFKRVYPHHVQEDGLKPIVCYGCLQICHKYCYGLNTPTNTEDDIEYFVCDPCRTNNKKHNVCEVCKGPEDLMKSLQGGGFIHPVCGFTHMEIEVVSYLTLEFKKASFYNDDFPTCCICDRENAYCMCTECSKKVHPLCVMKAYQQKRQEGNGEEIKNCWKFFMSSGENRQFDNATLLRLQSEEALEPEENKSEHSPHKSGDFVSEHKDNRLSTEQIRRGGFQYVLCPEHSQAVFYCNCGIEKEEEMVHCDCCLEWYHVTCSNFQDEGPGSDFICPFCIAWFALKHKIIKEIQSNKPETYELKLAKNPQLYIPDFILIAIVCDLRLSRAIETGNSSQKIIKTLELFPLKTSKISTLEEKKASVGDNINFDEIDQWITRSKDTQQIKVYQVKRIQELWQAFQPGIKNTEKYVKTRINYLTVWTNILKSPPQGVFVSHLKVRGLLYEYYQILRKYLMVSSTIIKTLKEPITYLQDLLQKLFPLVQKLNNAKTEADIEKLNYHIEVMDVSEVIIEAKVFLPTRKVMYVDVKLRRPYHDLNRFYQDFRKVNQTLMDQKIVYREEKKADLKRPAPVPSKEFQKAGGQVKKKVKKEEPIVPEKRDKTFVQLTVTEEDRKQIQNILLKNMSKNPEFGKARGQQFVRIIQNQIFGELHKNRNKYLQLSDDFEKLFITLQSCPLISAKAKKKNFQFTFMKGLVDNMSKIKEYEEKMQTKQKESQTTHAKELTQTPALLSMASNQQDDLLKSIFTGKIEEKQEKELEQIYALKRDSQREKNQKYYRGGERHKKERERQRQRDKGRDRYRERDKDRRDRSRNKDKRGSKESDSGEDRNNGSGQAKFSDQESEPQPNEAAVYDPLGNTRTNYIQKEYLRDEMFEHRNNLRNQPILYDPDQQNKPIQQKEKDIMKGTILKLRNCQLEIYLKKQGKMEMNGYVYTVEDPKKIKEVCDPDFEKYVIRKEKPEAEILDYLFKASKKKYRFVVGWFETETLKNNQYLHNLAVDCEERHKVFGLQNEMAKIHIMSSRQLSRDTSNRLRVPDKVTSEEVAAYLGERRLVFVLQYSIDKLFDVKSSTKPFSILPVESSYQVALDHPQFSPRLIHPTHAGMGMPYPMGIMPPLIMPQSANEYRNQSVGIETWDDEGPQIQMPQYPSRTSKQFSPITSEDEGMTEEKKLLHHTQHNEANNNIALLKILDQLDQSQLNKLAETQQPKQQQSSAMQYPPPSQMMQQRPQTSAYVYQGRMPGMHMPNHMNSQRPHNMQMPHQQQSGYNSQIRPMPNQYQQHQGMMPSQPSRYMVPTPNINQYYAPPPGGYPMPHQQNKYPPPK